MPPRLPVAFLALLALSALAERAVVPSKLSRTGVASDGRLVSTPKGFAVRNPFDESSQILLCGEGGKVLKLLDFCDTSERWWLSPGGEVLAVTRNGNLAIRVIDSGREEKDPTELAPDGDVSFTSDAARVAFAVGRAIVVLETKPDGKRFEIPCPKNSRIVEGPVFSGDGKGLFLVTAPVVDDAPNSVVGSPDSILACDPTAASPEWKTLFHADGGLVSRLAAAPAGGEVAFTVRKDKGCVLQLVNRETGTSEALSDSIAVGNVVFAPDGKRVVVTALGANGRVKALSVGTTRDGTKQTFPASVVGEFPDEDVIAVAPDADGCWLLVRKSTGPADACEVVRSTSR